MSIWQSAGLPVHQTGLAQAEDLSLHLISEAFPRHIHTSQRLRQLKQGDTFPHHSAGAGVQITRPTGSTNVHGNTIHAQDAQRVQVRLWQ